MHVDVQDTPVAKTLWGAQNVPYRDCTPALLAHSTQRAVGKCVSNSWLMDQNSRNLHNKDVADLVKGSPRGAEAQISTVAGILLAGLRRVRAAAPRGAERSRGRVLHPAVEPRAASPAALAA